MPSSFSPAPPDPATVTHLGLRFEAARRLGCEIRSLDSETGYLNEIRCGSVRRIFLGGMSPLNDAVASRIAGDKFHTCTALAARGYRIPESVRCLRPGHFPSGEYVQLEGLEPARELAEGHGYPLVVKPNFGSRGRGISVAHSAEELEEAVQAVWQRDYLALVQLAVPGFDLRIDFLDNQYLFGYTRRPVRIVADGKRSLTELLVAADGRFSGPSFEAGLARDPIWTQASGGLPLDAIPPEGQIFDAQTPILNLNRLCLATRVKDLDAPWVELGLGIGRTLSLRHFGIDLKIQSMADDPEKATVIEVNSAPSLAQMARMGHFEDAVAAETRILEKVFEAEAERLERR